MNPWMTVCIPTIGRPGLRRTLHSIRAQAPPAEVEIIVVADSFEGTFAYALVGALALSREFSARYLAHSGGVHCYGQPQRQHGMGRARGDWIMFSQDDNELNSGAITALRRQCRGRERLPRLFRAECTGSGEYVWKDRRLTVGNADADGMVVPNEPALLGEWTNGYAGDFDFFQRTVELHGGRMVFEPALIALKQK